MWDHESERLGKRMCTPVGYALHVIAELIGFLGLLFLLVIPGVLSWHWFDGTFRTAFWQLLLIPFGLGVISEVLFRFSWRLARRKDFRYDPERCEASWREAGERRTFTFTSPGRTP
jgi:hypothetical protein